MASASTVVWELAGACRTTAAFALDVQMGVQVLPAVQPPSIVSEALSEIGSTYVPAPTYTIDFPS